MCETILNSTNWYEKLGRWMTRNRKIDKINVICIILPNFIRLEKWQKYHLLRRILSVLIFGVKIGWMKLYLKYFIHRIKPSRTMRVSRVLCLGFGRRSPKNNLYIRACMCDVLKPQIQLQKAAKKIRYTSAPVIFIHIHIAWSLAAMAFDEWLFIQFFYVLYSLT